MTELQGLGVPPRTYVPGIPRASAPTENIGMAALSAEATTSGILPDQSVVAASSTVSVTAE